MVLYIQSKTFGYIGLFKLFQYDQGRVLIVAAKSQSVFCLTINFRESKLQTI